MIRSVKPWPSDAVMLVCSPPWEARTEAMESVHPGVCRDCGADVVYDGYSFRRISELPERRGRPVMFFCMRCAFGYDARTITHFEDHRGHPKEGT